MTVYYVDNSSAAASDRNSGTSPDSPLATLAAVSRLSLQPGDTVAFKAGTVYTADAAGTAALTITASGTAAQPITLTSYGSGAKPIINNSSTVIYSDAIGLTNAHYVTLDGLAFNNATQAAVNVASSSSNVTVQNSEMTNVGEGVLLAGTNSLVTGNSMHDLRMVRNTPTDTTNAATIAATDDDDYGANGVVVGGSNNEVSFNRIVNAKAPSYDYGFDGGGIELFGSISNVSIHDNYVAASEGFLEAGGSNATLSNITIANNVSFNNGNFVDLHNAGGSFGSSFNGVLIHNNTVVDQNNASTESAVVFFDGPATAAQVSVYANIFSLNDGDSVFKQVGTYHWDNLFDLQAADTHLYNDWSMTLGTGEQYGSAGFANLSAGDFTPTASGLAQTVGARLSTSLSDGATALLFGSFAYDTTSNAGGIYALYDALLDRTPDVFGFENYLNAMAHGASLHDVAASILGSAEAQSHLGAADNATFVGELYLTALHRTADTGGLQHYTALLNQGSSRVDIAMDIAFSAENEAGLQGALQTGVFAPDAAACDVARLYYGVLGRAPDAGGLVTYTTAVDHGMSLDDVATAMLGSAEYRGSHGAPNNASYVESLYGSALGRHSDPGGLQTYTAMLASGTSRADVAVAVAESGEAKTHFLSSIEQGWHLG